MARRETPLQWVPVLEAAGLHSARDLARELDVSPQTAVRLVHGEQSSRETIEAAATLLGVSPERVRQLREEVALPPFRLPPEADQLGQKQRSAIVAVVRAMLELTDVSPPIVPADPPDVPPLEYDTEQELEDEARTIVAELGQPGEGGANGRTLGA